MSDTTYDLVVIGSGPGGYIAAIRAAQLGMRVACVEKDPTLGGTCLNVGCIPSKALLDSSERYAEVNGSLARHGIRVSGVELDLGAMMKRKTGVVTALTKGVAGLFKKHSIDSIVGTGRIESPGVVAVNGEQPQQLAASRILIATGSAPAALPSLPFDGKRIVSSTEALELTTVPERMLVVGAGAIGLELGSVWNRLGSEVTVVELMDQIVPGADPDAAKALHRVLGKQGLKIRLQTTAGEAQVGNDGVTVTLSGNDEETEERFDVVLVAVGRRPYTEALGLDAIGVALDDRGRIEVGKEYQTNVPGVFAIGDVIAGPMLAHKAEDEGVAAAEMMAGLAGHVNYDVIPNVVYTWPELASVGKTEPQAREAGHEVRTGTFPFMANARARASNSTDGMVKIIADATTDRVLGVHIVGPSASELIAEAAMAMEFSASAEDIARTVHAHPTLAEAVREAALAVDGRTLNI